MVVLQWAGVLKAIVSLCCLSNYRDLFNLFHLVRRWCTATHTFFLSCSEITVTLEDVANQLLLPILGDVDIGAFELFAEEEAVEVELRKGMNGNEKLHIGLGPFPRLLLLLTMRPSSHSGSISSSLALILIML